MKKKNHKMIWMVVSLILSIIMGFGVIIVVTNLIQGQMVPGDYLFFELGQITGVVLIWLAMSLVILFCLLMMSKVSRIPVEELEELNDTLFIWNKFGKWRPIAVTVWLIAMYCCITNFTAVTPDKIICYSPWHPMGTEYHYSDVEWIKTGFGNKNYALAEYKKKGNFFYQIEVNGKRITFHAPTTNEDIERYVEHSYLELEEFDQALVALAIPKEADKKGWENCDLDKEFVDRFLRMIELK